MTVTSSAVGNPVFESDKYYLCVSENGKRLFIQNPYDPDVVVRAKNIKGRFFDWDAKHWVFPLAQIEEVKSAFPESEGWIYDGKLSAIAEQNKEALAVKQQEIEQQLALKEAAIKKLVEAGELDSPLLNGWKLREYQKEGSKFLLSNIKEISQYRGALLCDDVGLGKTLQLLAAAKAMQNEHDCVVFIICPKSLKDNWQKEASYFGIKIETFTNSFQSIPTPLELEKYVIIADEAHAFQSEKSKRTKLMKELVEHENCLAFWAATATPMRNGRPVNILPLLQMIGHEAANNAWQFKRRYCNAHKTRFGWDFTGSSHLAELSHKITPVLLRRTKEQVLSELPEKTRKIIPIDLVEKEVDNYKRAIRNLIADFRERAKEGKVNIVAEQLVTLGYARQESSLAKIPHTIELAEQILDQGRSVVIFSDFVATAERIKEHFKNVGCELLTGSTEDRQGCVDRFQNGESKVFVGTIKAGGTGITLTKASDMILVDRPWTPGDLFQVEGRCHRLKQTNPVCIQWVQWDQDKWIDDEIESKQSTIDQVLAGKNDTTNIKELQAAMFKNLLKNYRTPHKKS